MLAVKDVSKAYGGIHSLQNVSFTCEAGKTLGLVGPNGAGKTTLLNIISGMEKPDNGHVTLDGMILSGRSHHLVAAAGVARTFQKPRVFSNLSVFDNLCLALTSPLARAGGINQKDVTVTVYDALEQIGFNGRGNVLAGELSYGQQKLLEITRVSLCRPRVMLLDEPSAGMHDDIKPLLLQVIAQLCVDGSIVIIVEHDIEFLILAVTSALVMSEGHLVADLRDHDLSSDRISDVLGFR